MFFRILRTSLPPIIFTIAASFAVMKLYENYLAGLCGAENIYGEYFISAQAVILVINWIFGLMLVGRVIFTPTLPGIVCKAVKLFFVIISIAIMLLSVELIAYISGKSVRQTPDYISEYLPSASITYSLN